MAQIIRYVDPDATGAGNGTTWADAYTSLSAWEAAEQQDLTDAGGDYMTVYCRSLAGTDDTTAVTILGWTTGPSNYIEIIGNDFPANGIFDGTKYVLTASNTNLLVISENYVRIDHLQLVGQVSGTGSLRSIYIAGIDAGGSDIRISRSIVKAGASMTGTGVGIGIHISDPDATVTIWNCIVYGYISASDPTDTGFGGIVLSGLTNGYVYNCTVFGNYFGFYLAGGQTATAKNCASFNNTDDFQPLGTFTIDYCASDDGDGTNPQDFTAEATDWNAVFTDYANGDVTLKNYTTSPCAVGQGVDDPGAGLYSDDITGTARSSTWDIGAFEYVSTSLSINVFDSVTVSDEPAVRINPLLVLVFSALLVIDAVAATINPLQVNVSDNVQVTDVSGNELSFYKVDVFDSVQAADECSAIIPILQVAVFDSLTVSDDAQGKLSLYEAAVSDPVTVSDYTEASLVSAETLSVNVSDNVQVSDEAAVALDVLKISVFDEVTVSDEAEAGLNLYQIAVSDNVEVSDAVEAKLNLLEISVFDSVTVTDLSDHELSVYRVNVSDDVQVSDETILLLNLLLASVSDALSITDDVSALLNLLLVSVSDTLTVQDEIAVSIPVLYISVSDDLAVTDSASGSLNLYEISVADNVGVSDYTTGQLTGGLEISVSDEIGLTDAPLLLLSTDYVGRLDLLELKVSNIELELSGMKEEILAAIALITVKLPTNYLMGSSNQTNKDDEIDAIQDDLNIITGAAGVLIDDAAITQDAFDNVTAFPVAKVDTGATEIARTGADSDTLETLSDQLDTVTANTGKVVYGAVTSGQGTPKAIAAGSVTGFVEDDKL